MSIPLVEVVKPGFMTTVQDRGRFGYQYQGISMSGALDSFSYRIGNILVGNDENDAGLEVTVIGPTLRMLKNTTIAVTGADMAPMKNGTPIPMWASIAVTRGDIISFGPLREGCRTYFAIRKGISAPLVHGSRSTNMNSREGGIEGRALKEGDILEGETVGSEEFEERKIPHKFIPRFPGDITVSVILGPQERQFHRERGIERFLASTYQVTLLANRAGYRLDGPAIEHRKGIPTSIPSEACTVGGIQVPPDGKPIILLRDQHGGGYAKIAAVVSYDLDRVAQLKPGNTIRFRRISLTIAHKALKEREETIRALKERFTRGVRILED